MSIIDFFRPKWRHSDVEVRAEAVRALGPHELAALVAVAQKDKDARVRRIAVKRLDDPALLTDIAAHDPDESIRELAGDKATTLLIAAACADSAEAPSALGRLSDERHLAEVARRAQRAEIRKQAVARMRDGRALLEVIRRATTPDVKQQALDRLSDPALLKEIALGDETKGLALAAVARITDPELLEEISRGAKAKAARAAAKARLPEEPGAPPAAPVTPRTPDKTRRARLLQLALAAEAVAQRSDWEAAGHELDELQNRMAEFDFTSGDAAIEQRFATAVAKFMTRREAELAARSRAVAEAAAKKAKAAAAAAAAPPPPPEPAPLPVEPVAPRPRGPSRADRLLALVLEAERSASGKVNEARLTDLERRWHQLDASADSDEDEEVAPLRTRFETARLAMTQRLSEERARIAAQLAEQRAKLERGCADLEKRIAAPNSKGADQALRAAQALLRGPGEPALKQRLSGLIDALGKKLGEQREAESWKRFASVPKLEALCKEAEALAEVVGDVEDKRRAPALLKELQVRWKEIGPAPKDKHEALWTRFKAACDAVYEKSKDYFGKLEEERGGNLAKKEELCVKVEALKDSTDWKETSEAIKKLQEEWKAIGPVPKDKGDAAWKRFRAACDIFFTRRNENDKSRDEARAANLQRKELLCARIEGIAHSTDWKQTADVIKAAQEEWQAIGPVPRAEGDVLWKRFRAACDGFFAARKAAFEKADAERGDNLVKKLALCEKAEALAGAEDHEAAMAQAKELQAEWKATGPVPREQSDALWSRFRNACDVVFAGPSAASVAEVQAVNASGVSGFTNRLPLDRLAAKLAPAMPPATERPPGAERLRAATTPAFPPPPAVPAAPSVSAVAAPTDDVTAHNSGKTKNPPA